MKKKYIYLISDAASFFVRFHSTINNPLSSIFLRFQRYHVLRVLPALRFHRNLLLLRVRHLLLGFENQSRSSVGFSVRVSILCLIIGSMWDFEFEWTMGLGNMERLKIFSLLGLKRKPSNMKEAFSISQILIILCFFY